MMEKLTITVRVASPANAVRAQELRKLAWQNHYIYPETGVTQDILAKELAPLPVENSDVAYFQTTLSANPGKNLVALVEGQVVGIVFYETIENGNGDIGVFVDEAYNNRGVGDALLKELIRRTDNTLEVTIFAKNPSREFYRRHGFTEVGEEKEHEFRPHVTLPTQRLILRR